MLRIRQMYHEALINGDLKSQTENSLISPEICAENAIRGLNGDARDPRTWLLTAVSGEITGRDGSEQHKWLPGVDSRHGSRPKLRLARSLDITRSYQYCTVEDSLLLSWCMARCAVGVGAFS